MKLYLYPIIALGLIASSCNNDAVEEPQPSVIAKNTITYSPSAVNRTLDEAISIANEAKGMLNNSKSSRAGINREIDLTDGIKYVVSNVSRSNPDTLLYILNYKDNAGFAVISTRRSTEALLAVTESGTYTSPEDCDNPGFNMFMDMATAYVANAPVEPVKPPTTPGVDGPFEIQEVKREEITLVNDTLPHRVEVEWVQSGIFGAYCKNGIAGCNNVAAGMAMSYFEYPSSISLTYMDTPQNMTLDWKNIKRHKKGIYDFCCQPNSPHTTIGKLLRELGHRSGSNYNSAEATSTLPSKTRSALKKLGFKVGDIKKYYSKCIWANIGDGVIIISGYQNSDGDGGHTWLVDGYAYLKKQVIEYVRPISSPEWIETENVITEYMYNWFNWGMNNYDNTLNGYYSDGVFITRSPEHYNLGYNVKFFTVNI